jgi:hypothetical protein
MSSFSDSESSLLELRPARRVRRMSRIVSSICFRWKQMFSRAGTAGSEEATRRKQYRLVSSKDGGCSLQNAC